LFYNSYELILEDEDDGFDYGDDEEDLEGEEGFEDEEFDFGDEDGEEDDEDDDDDEKAHNKMLSSIENFSKSANTNSVSNKNRRKVAEIQTGTEGKATQ
jgi:hypothetical protein